MPVTHSVPSGKQVSLLIPAFPDDCQPEQILPRNCVFTDITATTYEEAINCIVNRLEKQGYVNDAFECLEDILTREQTSTTILENDIALPRARTNQVRRLTAAVALCHLSEMEENKPRTLITVLILTPKSGDTPYMQFIAHIARALLNHPDLEALRNLVSPDQLRQTFL